MSRRRSHSSISALFRKAIADVTRRRGRTILVVLGIMIGVFGLTTINVANDLLGTAFAYTHSLTAAPDITIGVQGVAPEIADTLKTVPNVKTLQIDTLYPSRWRIAAAPGHTSIDIVGYADFQTVKLNPFQLVSGRFPQGTNEIALEESDQTVQHFAIGDTITVETAHGPQRLRVVGQTRTLGLPGPVFIGSTRGYMSATGVWALASTTQANMIEVQVNNPAQAEQTQRALNTLLQQQNITVLASNVLDRNADPGASLVNALLIIMRVLSLIALLLTGFLILNTVTTMVTEQMRVIGSMKAIGGTSWKIMRSYLFSVGIYGILGTAFGLGLGLLGGYKLAAGIADLLVLDTSVASLSPWILLFSILAGLGIPLLAACLPLWHGTHITVREAMAGYGVSGGGSQGRLVRRMTWVRQTTWLSLRTIFRKRGRTALTLLALTFSAIAFLSIQTTTYSFDRALAQFSATSNFDVSVSISPQSYERVQQQVMTLPNVARIERRTFQEVKTGKGNMQFMAVESDTQLYKHDMVTGRWFSRDEPGAIVISDIMQQRTQLKVGNVLTISNARGATNWHIIGVVRDINGSTGGLIGEGITTIANMDSFMGFPTSMVTSFVIGAHDRSAVAVERLANRLDDTLSRAGMAPAVTTIQQIVQRNQSEFQIVDILLYAVAAIVALVGTLGLLNTLTTSILERRREIGVLRAIGATRRQIAAISWREGAALALIASGFAAVLGIPCSYAFVSLISSVLVPVPFAFSVPALGLMLLFVLILASVASVGPALSAARIRIVETLRYE